MSLTFSRGPLAANRIGDVNYTIDGPEHLLLFDEFPRRVRAVLGGETVLDTREGKLLHETNYLPQLYVPIRDLPEERLIKTEHRTRCPYKGDASYWSIRVGDRTVENAVWAFEQPNERAGWLRGYRALDFNAADAWFDEDEEIVGSLRDPYHRVDVRDTSRHIRILVNGEVIADSQRPKIMSETGLPNRYYLPMEDVRHELLEPSGTHSACPYKGVASYYTISMYGRRIPDGAWFYPQALENAAKAQNHLCFLGEGIVTEIDGELES